MHTTSLSLLERLKTPADREAWDCFVELYTPLLHQCALRLGLQGHDAADLVQDVLVLLLRKLASYKYEPGASSFRGWLRTVTINKWRENLRRAPVLGTAIDDVAQAAFAPVELPEFEESEYRDFVIKRTLEILEREYPRLTWRAFWEYHILGRAPADVAAELGLTVGSVYAAKSRIASRLRAQLEGLLD
jgi:RNA polymerase sigma-70 factor (ECF subfamily)